MMPGKGLKVHIEGKNIALFRHGEIIYAFQNNCPHQNADLAEGYIKDGKVYCNLHHWAFDLKTGAYAFNSNMQLNTYDVRVEDEVILVGIEFPESD
jgi:nitrite reductase/ring-hydroxylating ferredoxin subunit